MNVKKIQQKSIKQYMAMLGTFLVYMVICLFVFICCVQKNIEKNAEEAMRDNVTHQSYHFQTIMDTQFEYLESIADYLGRQEELLSAENMELIRSLHEKSGMKLVAIIDAEGNSYYDNGAQKSVAARAYFQEAMKGKRTLSDPLESMVDGDTRVILGVPIYRGEEIVGVLGGSYNVGELSHLMFADIYDGAGYSMIVAGDGTLISNDQGGQSSRMTEGDNFFAHYGEGEFLGLESIEQIKADFSAQNGGYVCFSQNGEECYLAYEPLEMGSWMLCYVAPVKKAHEEFRFIQYYETILAVVLGIGIFVLVFSIWRMNSRMQKNLILYAQMDPLTDICNKKRTEEEIDSWFADEQCGNIQAFIMMDVDYFKLVNDRYGHAAGDEVLCRIAEILRRSFMGSDIIGRIGGDEFAVLMKNIPSAHTAISHAENICAAIRGLKLKETGDMQLSVSIGIAIAPYHGKTYQELYKCADKALYETKERGRNGYSLYGQEAF